MVQGDRVWWLRFIFKQDFLKENPVTLHDKALKIVVINNKK